jgi:hypothetical protein
MGLWNDFGGCGHFYTTLDAARSSIYVISDTKVIFLELRAVGNGERGGFGSNFTDLRENGDSRAHFKAEW